MRRSEIKRNVERIRTWVQKHRKPILRRTPIKLVNRERKAARYEKQFGEKSEWLREVQSHCPVSGRARRLECAHVGRALKRGHRRSRGAGNDLIVLLHWLVHRDYDDFRISEADFESRYPGWTRARIDEVAQQWELAWQREREA